MAEEPYQTFMQRCWATLRQHGVLDAPDIECLLEDHAEAVATLNAYAYALHMVGNIDTPEDKASWWHEFKHLWEDAGTRVEALAASGMTAGQGYAATGLDDAVQAARQKVVLRQSDTSPKLVLIPKAVRFLRSAANYARLRALWIELETRVANQEPLTVADARTCLFIIERFNEIVDRPDSEWTGNDLQFLESVKSDLLRVHEFNNKKGA